MDLSKLKSSMWFTKSNSNEKVPLLEKFDLQNNPLNGLKLQEQYVPEEILLIIFAYLSPKDILKCSLVCKRWYNIAKSNALWQRIYNRKEHPRKSKHLPWYVYYCYFATDNFKNLIKNGNGEDQFDHWRIIFNEGDRFRIENPPEGASPLPDMPEFHGHTSCFATSYEQCSKQQKINLKQKPLLRHIIKKYHPALYASEWYTGRFDCGALYVLSLICDDSEKDEKWDQPETYRLSRFRVQGRRRSLTTPRTFKSVYGQIEPWQGKEWEKLEIIYDDYPKDTMSVYFHHSGRDTQFWAGHYGSKMAGGVLKFLFDSIEPAKEDLPAEEESRD